MSVRYLLTFLFIFIFNTAFSTPSGDHRKSLEAGIQEVASHTYSQDYDITRSQVLNIITEAEKDGYWDLCIQGLGFLAYISDVNHHHEVMKEAIERGQVILQSKSTFLDSLDPDFILRSDMIMMSGVFYAKNNEIEKADRIFQSLVRKINEVKVVDKATVFTAYAYIADAYMDMGLYEKVYPLYILMEQFIPDGPYHDFYSYLHLQYLGTYFYKKKSYPEAKSYLIRALKRIKPGSVSDDWKYYVISNYDVLALIHQNLNQPDSALWYMNKSLAILDPDDPRITDTYENFGDCLFRAGDFKGALAYFEKVNQILIKGTSLNPYRRAQILSKISETRYYTGNFSEAVSGIQQAFSILYKDASFLKNPERNPELSMIQADKTLVRLLAVKSTALFELAIQGPLKEHHLIASLATFRLSTLIIDKFRHRMNTDDFKEIFVTDIRPMYERAIKACYIAYEVFGNDSIINLAFYFMEKSRNQVLLDAIQSYYARNLGNIPEPIIAAENQYRIKLVDLQNLIYGLSNRKADSSGLQQYQYDYAETQRNYEEFLRGIEREYPGYYNLKYKSEIPSIIDMQKTIQKGVMIEYMAGDDYIGIIALGKKKSVFKLMPVNTEFHDHLNGLLKDLGSGSIMDHSFDVNTYKDFVTRAGALYSILLKPALDEFDQPDQLIIVPDGQLCFLPFDVLISNYPVDMHVVDYRNLSYALKDHIIRYEYSAMQIYENRDHKGKIKSNYLGFAPAYSQQKGSGNANVPGRENSFFLTPLKYARHEVEAAASIFKGTAYIGERAISTRFKDFLSAKIIHFAGHTFINDSLPGLSGLFFSDHSERDVIYANEIFNLNLNSELIILSACETGRGKLREGEGIISIGRAFKYAGCRSLIMSLWKINDRSTSDIMIRFCRNLKKGQRTDAALRNAKLAYMNSSESSNGSHPFLWSAFIMIGDHSPLFRNRYKLWIFSVLLLISVVVVFKYIRKRVRMEKFNSTVF